MCKNIPIRDKYIAVLRSFLCRPIYVWPRWSPRVEQWVQWLAKSMGSNYPLQRSVTMLHSSELAAFALCLDGTDSVKLGKYYTQRQVSRKPTQDPFLHEWSQLTTAVTSVGDHVGLDGGHCPKVHSHHGEAWLLVQEQLPSLKLSSVLPSTALLACVRLMARAL